MAIDDFQRKWGILDSINRYTQDHHQPPRKKQLESGRVRDERNQYKPLGDWSINNSFIDDCIAAGMLEYVVDAPFAGNRVGSGNRRFENTAFRITEEGQYIFENIHRIFTDERAASIMGRFVARRSSFPFRNDTED